MSAIVFAGPPRRQALKAIAVWGGSALAHAGLIAALIAGFDARQAAPVATPPVMIQLAAAPSQTNANPARPPAVTAPSAAHASARPAPPVPAAGHRPVAPVAPVAPARPPTAAPFASHALSAEAAHADASPPAAAMAPSSPSSPLTAASSTVSSSAALPAAAAAFTPPSGNAAYLHNPAPRYPEEAEADGWTGRVTLRVHVDAQGHPLSVEVRTSSGHGVLDQAALAAVRRWAFVPARRGAEPVDGWVDVPLDFHLD